MPFVRPITCTLVSTPLAALSIGALALYIPSLDVRIAPRA